MALLDIRCDSPGAESLINTEESEQTWVWILSICHSVILWLFFLWWWKLSSSLAVALRLRSVPLEHFMLLVALWDAALGSALLLPSRNSNCSGVGDGVFFFVVPFKYLVFHRALASRNHALPQLGRQHIIMHIVSKHTNAFGLASAHLRISGLKYLVFPHMEINRQSNASVCVPTVCCQRGDWVAVTEEGLRSAACVQIVLCVVNCRRSCLYARLVVTTTGLRGCVGSSLTFSKKPKNGQIFVCFSIFVKQKCNIIPPFSFSIAAFQCIFVILMHLDKIKGHWRL